MLVGATYLGDGVCEYTVWAPQARKVAVRIHGEGGRSLAMEAIGRGYWRVRDHQSPPGTRYTFVLDGGLERPDPASHSQPEGVHAPSEVVDHRAYAWGDGAWRGLALEDYVFYEVHVGTFTPEGTFASTIAKLPYLRELGITAVEIMPVAQFPGDRNWGYDGAYPYAPQSSYGGPAGLKALVDACHREGLAAVLDVVYNHFGPEGTYVADFGPYFTDRHSNAWGHAVNFDGEGSRGVRDYFLENALHWFRHYHFDALRLDAVHAIFDDSPKPILRELAERAEELALTLGRPLHLVAESDLNDPALVRSAAEGGLGMDAQWSDDFHHSLHAVLTGESSGYYKDFGGLGHLAQAFREPFVYQGQWSNHRGKPHGAPSAGLPSSRFVVCAQNHDQIGNRFLGERLAQLLPAPSLRLAAAATVLAPYLPLVFMGECYGERAPFRYFVDHRDPVLVEAVTQGRIREFASFGVRHEPPDPFDPGTFAQSKLRWETLEEPEARGLLEFYREMIRLRKAHPALALPRTRPESVEYDEEARWLYWIRGGGGARMLALFNFGDAALEVSLMLPKGGWGLLLHSGEARFTGGPEAAGPDPARPGAALGPLTVALYEARG